MKNNDLPFDLDKNDNKQQNKTNKPQIIMDKNLNDAGYFIKTKRTFKKERKYISTYTKTYILNKIKSSNPSYFDLDTIINHLIELGFKSNLHGEKIQARLYNVTETKYIYYEHSGFSINLFRDRAHINGKHFKTTEEAIAMIDKIKSLCDSYVLFVVKNNRPFVLGKSGKFYQKLPKFNFEYNYEDKVFKTIDTIFLKLFDF